MISASLILYFMYSLALDVRKEEASTYNIALLSAEGIEKKHWIFRRRSRRMVSKYIRFSVVHIYSCYSNSVIVYNIVEKRKKI